MLDDKNVTFDTNRARDYFLDRISYSLGPVELNHLIKNDLDHFTLTDVRKYDDYIDGHIPFAMHLPINELEEHLNMFDKCKINIIYCYNSSCKLATKMCLKLAEKGYPVMELSGGYKTWEKFGFDIIKES